MLFSSVWSFAAIVVAAGASVASAQETKFGNYCWLAKLDAEAETKALTVACCSEFKGILRNDNKLLKWQDYYCETATADLIGWRACCAGADKSGYTGGEVIPILATPYPQ